MLHFFPLIILLITNSFASENNGLCKQEQAENEDLENIKSLVDLEKYPLHLPQSTEYDELIEFCKTQLRKYGSVDLPGFIRAEVLYQMAEQVNSSYLVTLNF